MSITDDDVPSPIDLRDPQDVAEWVANADRVRPWRAELRDAFAAHLASLARPPRRVLELGAGPGLLAEVVVGRLPLDDYTLFDFSPPMLERARARLASHPAHPAVRFVLGDFKAAGWTRSLAGRFGAVLAMQSIHEIRHKRHVPRLYAQVRTLLAEGGVFLICDHNPLDDSAAAAALYATEGEQHEALRSAGFADARTLLTIDRMYLCAAVNPEHGSEQRCST